MKILVVGASGATGRLLVEQLLNRDHDVKAIVRSPASLPETLRNHKRLTVIQASLLNLSDADLAEHVNGCGAVASCLGHNINFKGIWGKPRRLVTDATRRLCEAIWANHAEKPTKFVLMNTVGNRNRDRNEPISLAQRSAIGLMRLLLPPVSDNEQAAETLRTQVGQHDPLIEWAAVRPDSLFDTAETSEYEIHPSPLYSLFKPGKTSRINVGHFMAELITNDETWQRWKGQMPVLYNKSVSPG